MYTQTGDINERLMTYVYVIFRDSIRWCCVQTDSESSVEKLKEMLRSVVRQDASKVEEKDLYYCNQPVMLYAADTWTTTKGQEARIESNETKMLRWMYRVTTTNKIRNEYIRRTTRVINI